MKINKKGRGMTKGREGKGSGWKRRMMGKEKKEE